MSALAALARRYDRRAAAGDAPPFGYALQGVGWCLVLEPDGRPSGVIPLVDESGKKPRPRSIAVPRPEKRTSGIASNFLWDKTSYVLGVTAGDGKRVAKEHEAFEDLHRSALAGSGDEGLTALLAFLDRWRPEDFAEPMFPEAMKDGNVVFRLSTERGFLHERPAAKAIWAGLLAGTEAPEALCLVTGKRGPIARLHPAIKGVWGAQSSGASIVSFNLDAFESYGQKQGDNAPVSEAAAFAYTTELNELLSQGSRNRVQIGDASTVFWAEADEEDHVVDAEATFAAIAGGYVDIEKQEDSIAPIAKGIAEGRPLSELAPQLAEGVRFYVLGLSPNASRLHMRYWFEGDFGTLAERFRRYYQDVHIEPRPAGWHLPALNFVLARTTALLGKYDNIPVNLAGEVMRSILSGATYPRTLLATAIMRLRAGDDPRTGWHAAVIKACLTRATEVEVPMALDPDRDDQPYQLGRLFAVMEAAQYAALGRVNATIADRYYAAASATPARVFGPLMRSMKVHIADARKRNRGGWIEPRVIEIVARLDPELKTSLTLEEQGRFAIGYYHERSRAKKADDAPETPSEATEDDA